MGRSQYLRKRTDADWCAYENSARKMKRGLWVQPPREWIDPGEWRRRKQRHYTYGLQRGNHRAVSGCDREAL